MTINQIILITRNSYQSFPFHLVSASPWPISVSFSLLSLMLGAIMYMHGFNYGDFLLDLGFYLTLGAMVLWFRDVISEGTYNGDHTKEVQRGFVIGFLLFIISEIFAFLSVFWAFFHSSLSASIAIGGVWPPAGITPLDPYSIPMLNTFLLVSSGGFITYGHHALMQGKRKDALWGVIITIILAIIFTGLQYYEYSGCSFTMADSIYGSLFFASTGLHGIHVVIGTLLLLVGFYRIINYHVTDTHHQGLEAAIIYWHFVDVVWIFLFSTVYCWSSV